jgi:hypothetical protein
MHVQIVAMKQMGVEAVVKIKNVYNVFTIRKHEMLRNIVSCSLVAVLVFNIEMY